MPHPSFSHPPPPQVRDQAESVCLLLVTVPIYTVILHTAWWKFFEYRIENPFAKTEPKDERIPFLYSSNFGFWLIVSLAIATSLAARVSARPSICLFGTPLYRVSIHLCASWLSSNSVALYLVLACSRLLAGIRLICTGKINNPRRDVSIAKTQHNVLYGCSRVVNASPKS